MEAVYEKIDKVFFELAKKVKATVPECICGNETNICTCECKNTTPEIRKLVRIRRLLRVMRNLLIRRKVISVKLEAKTKICIDNIETFEGILKASRESNETQIENCSSCQNCPNCRRFTEVDKYLSEKIQMWKDRFHKNEEKAFRERALVKYIAKQIATIEKKAIRLAYEILK